MCFLTIPPSWRSRDTSALLCYAQPSVSTGPPLHKGGLMPRRCRGVRGDVGIAPYGRFVEVRSYNVSPSVNAPR